jgi:NADH-quinone oxidoreductase subunit N
MNEFFTLMKSELLVTGILFLLLFIKIGKGIKNESLLPIIQFLLLANFIAGFFLNSAGSLFDDMFNTKKIY